MTITENQTWWKRNWKWALPTGGCLTIIVVVLSLIGYWIYEVSDKISNETNVFAFVKVIQTVQSDRAVADALGKPIEIKANGYDPDLNDGTMNLEIDLEGKKANGLLKVNATKTESGWEYSLFTITIEDTGEVIDLTNKINE